MTLTALRKSRAMWRRRVKYRRARLKVATTAAGKAKWRKLLAEAQAIVKRRDKQLAGQDNAEQISAKGLSFLTRHEGVRRYAYNDSQGHATFGVGHLIHHGPVTLRDRLKWGTPRRPASMKKVLDVLDRDLDQFEKAVRDSVKVPLKQHEFDACVSLAFNVGAGGFASSTVVRVLNDRNLRRAVKIQRAAAAFLLWNKPPEIMGRRHDEHDLFRDGRYTG